MFEKIYKMVELAGRESVLKEPSVSSLSFVTIWVMSQ